jgi:hypothetical protein
MCVGSIRSKRQRKSETKHWSAGEIACCATAWCATVKDAHARRTKFRSFSVREAAQEAGDVEQGTPIGPTTLLAGQITDIAYKATVV